MSGPVGSQQWMYSSGFYPHEIGNSVRFDTNSYLARTPSSASNRTTWTWSGWFKMPPASSQYTLFFAEPSLTDYTGIIITSGAQLQLINRPATGVNASLISTQVLRDASAWYHLVGVWDTTNSTQADRVRLYVNGERVTSFSTSTLPSQNAVSAINSTGSHLIGATFVASGSSLDNVYDGYTAEVNFVDGQALDPSYFGETKADTWIPKKYTGSYGTNGYYLPFNDAGFLGKDASTVLGSELVTNGTFDTNINNWTAHNGATLALSNNRLSVHESPGFDAGAYQAISVESGKTYSIEATVDKGTTNGARVGVEYTLGGRDGVETSSNTGGHFQFTFTPSSTGTVYVRCFIQAAGTAYFDNISVKEITTQGNDFTSTNVLVTDQMLDSPTNNWATFNPVFGIGRQDQLTYSEGNLQVVSGATGGNDITSVSTISPSGKVYAEFVVKSDADGAYIGAMTPDVNLGNGGVDTSNTAGVFIVRGDNGHKAANDGGSAFFGSAFSNGDIIQVAVDTDSQKLWFGRNGTWGSAGNPSTGANAALGASDGVTSDLLFICGDNYSSKTPTIVANFGQDSSFAGNKTAQGNTDAKGLGDFYYSPPAGFLALCTANLPDPVAAFNPAVDASPQDHFNTVTFTANNGTQSISGVGFQPDFVWAKSRGNNYNHDLYDSVRGVGRFVSSNSKTQESVVANSLTSFNSDGFTLGVDSNANYGTAASVSWNWKAGGSGVSNTDGTITSTVSANTDAGFSIVTYTGNGSASATVGHGLGATPAMVIVKCRSDGADEGEWTTAHQGISGQVVFLNQTLQSYNPAVFSTGGVALGNSSAFSFINGTASVENSNKSGNTYVAYCFAEVEGFSKFGSYTGNGEDDGLFIYTGFRPAWILLKRTDAGNNWVLLDNKRDPYNVAAGTIYANQNYAENANYIRWDMVSNGFKLRKGGSGWLDQNASAGTYIYMAFAEMPFKYANAR